MSEKDDGGPAFPVTLQNVSRGMSLRDWFAGQQMVRIASGWPNDETMKDIAKRCYAMADAFLAERSKP